MNNYEFLSYKAYPSDQYTAATCKVRVDRKYVFTFVQKKMKDGGLFWTAPSVNVNDEGEKKYISAHMLDSQVESEMIIDFIKDNVKRLNATHMPKNATLLDPISQSYQGSSYCQPSGVADQSQEQLPF